MTLPPTRKDILINKWIKSLKQDLHLPTSSPPFLGHTHTHIHWNTYINIFILPPFSPSPSSIPSLQRRIYSFMAGWQPLWLSAPRIWSLFPPPRFCLITASLLDTFPSGGCLTSSVAYKYTPLHESQPCHAKGACITQQSYKSCHEGPHKKMGHSEMFWKKCSPLEEERATHSSMIAWRTPGTVWKGKKIWHWKISLPSQKMCNKLLGKSGGQLLIAPERTKQLGQSRNDTQCGYVWWCK